MRVPEGHKGELRDLGVLWHRPFSSASCARGAHVLRELANHQNASTEEADAVSKAAFVAWSHDIRRPPPSGVVDFVSLDWIPALAAHRAAGRARCDILS